MTPRCALFSCLAVVLLTSIRAQAVTNADIPPPEVELIRAIGFFEAPRVIAGVCSEANPSSAAEWNREVEDFEHRRAAEGEEVRRLFWGTYGLAVAPDDARAILAAKVKRRLADEADAYHVGNGLLCTIVSLFGGKRVFESKGFEETLRNLSQFEKQGAYTELRTRIEKLPPEDRGEYRKRLMAYEPKPAH
jgi:hypothetical protein